MVNLKYVLCLLTIHDVSTYMCHTFSTSFNNYADIVNQYYLYNKLYGIALHTTWQNQISETRHRDNFSVLKEVIDIRDGFKYCAALSMNEVGHSIEEIWLFILFSLFKI